ncbi:hypothetical protein Glove_86g58 [Diversispora epigaea]|uniref:Protein kinase domain-containing protein n=2 Tax=Diversispora epigaea TaxID=1348612 RepID=A0A397J6E2_9GLOM|nr:hypothetical protein Glove_86g58 [Diversispora epigaea]
MSQEIEKLKYCPGYSYFDYQRSVQYGRCASCTKDHYIQEFKTWSSGNADIDEIIQDSQIKSHYSKLQWIPYDNFQTIEHIADGGHGSVYSAKLENGIKKNWNFIKRDWEYVLIGNKVAFKEVNSRYDIAELLKVVKTVNDSRFFAKYYGISKNPSTQNYIIVMDLFDDDLHDFLTKTFWELGWQSKIEILFSTAYCLENLNEQNLVHCDLHSGNIWLESDSIFLDLGLCILENDVILNTNIKNNKIYGSIPYIPPEVLRGNEFIRASNIYSFGGIMYEIVTAQRPFADQAHDTYLMIDICNGVRPKVPDFILNWIPEWYLDLMYRCWNDDPSERPTADELSDLFYEISDKLINYIMDDDVMQQLEIADENQKKYIKISKARII